MPELNDIADDAKPTAAPASERTSTAREDYLLRQSIRVPKTAEVVANHVRKRIIRGELKEGDFLPPEGQLMSTLGISRPTLREAFRILEAEMLISVVRGSRTGARVHLPRVESVSRYAAFVLQAQGTTIADIYHARLAIEPMIARQLAEKQVPGATDQLRAEAERLTAMVDGKRYIDFMIGIAEFHRLLVELGGNHTLLLLTTILQDVVARYQVEFLSRRGIVEEEQRRLSLWGIKSFKKLIELIDAGKGVEAEAHWRLHVVNANHTWVDGSNGLQLIDILD